MNKIGLSFLCMIIIIVSFQVSIKTQPLIDYDNYYTELRQESLNNLDVLPKIIKDKYMRLLNQHPNIIMAFILAKEESSKLMLANPGVILDHYHEISKLWTQNNSKYSIPFFLSYIAKVTVTEERITPYRDLFRQKGLYDLPYLYPDLEDLVREVNLWTRKFMTFQPTSGRDMAPTDVINRTNIGRCEEMMIFFISAARSLGIPARPASTSFWAHTDNNHAWVEVYINGKWQHLGAVEPSYHLNDAWFTSNTAKAIMITTTAVLPDTSDIIVGKRGNSYLINSTPNYDSHDIQSRSVNITTQDEMGNILPNSKINLKVFNWGRLRTVLTTETDDYGMLNLITGNGSFFVTAANEDLFAINNIPANIDDYNLLCSLKYHQNLSSFSTELHYNDHILEKRLPAEDWADRTAAVADKYNRIVSEYQELSFPKDDADSLLSEVWSLCRNNKDNFLDFYLNRSPDKRFMTFLTKLDPKFLWQATTYQFNNLHNTYIRIKDLDYPDDVLLVLLSPTVFFEEIPQKLLSQDLTIWRNSTPETHKIIDYLKNKYQIDNDKAIQQFQMSSDILMNLPILTSYQYKILTCAVLNANFIPARYTRLPDIISVYTAGLWRYYNISENRLLTSSNQDISEYLVKIETIDEFGYPITLESNQYTLTFLENGRFYNNERSLIPNPEGYLEADLEQGTYQLHIGYRINNNLTHFTLENINTFNKPVIKKIILNKYPRQWQKPPTEIIELITMIRDTLSDHETISYYLFGPHDSEIVIRVSQQLVSLAEPYSYIWIGRETSPDTPSFYTTNELYKQWLQRHPQFENKAITIHMDKDLEASYFEGFWDYLPIK